MTTDAFWTLIDEARHSGSAFIDIPDYLLNALCQREESEIFDYDSHFVTCMARAYDAKLWLGAVVILLGCGDDRFMDFRCWLIAQGRDVFEAALADPDSMADLERFDGDYGQPTLFYLSSVAVRAFCQRAGVADDDFQIRGRFEALCPRRKHPALKNSELVNSSYETAKAMFPKLAARFPNGV